MKQITRQAVVFRIIFYLGATGLILAVWQFQKHMPGGFIEPTISSINSIQQRQLDAVLEMNRLITTLGTGLLGATGFLLINMRKAYRRSVAFWVAFGSAVCVGLSIFFGYVVYLGLIAMLQSQFFNVDIPPILWVREAHFYLFLLGVVLFGDFAFQSLREEDGHERTRDAADH